MNVDALMQRAKAIFAMAGFAAPQWWLTFYVTGNPDSLDRVAERLAARGTVNLGGTEGGFIYPKPKVASDAAIVAKAVADVQQLAALDGVTLLSVDVDTSPNVERSLFKELIRFDANDN